MVNILTKQALKQLTHGKSCATKSPARRRRQSHAAQK
jgi:hypothetical protein